jgi:hypothetical protein
MPTPKTAAQELREEVEAYPNIQAANESELWAAFASLALTKLEECYAKQAQEDDVEGAEACAKAAKRANKYIQGLLPEKNALDLGQYSNTNVFHGDQHKASKFARLMGGGKKDAHHEHGTYAMAEDEAKRMQRQLEEQFNSAISHKGSKKGLGL